jgi:hypothetical protein
MFYDFEWFFQWTQAPRPLREDELPRMSRCQAAVQEVAGLSEKFYIVQGLAGHARSDASSLRGNTTWVFLRMSRSLEIGFESFQGAAHHLSFGQKGTTTS